MKKYSKIRNIIFKWLPVIIFISSIFSIYLIQFCWNDVPEKWEYGYESGQLIYSLGMAYISSFVFYILIVLIPEKKKKKNIYQHIKPKNNAIFHTGNGIIYGIKDHNKAYKDREKEITEQEFLKICQQIGPNDTQDLFLTANERYPITYIEHINKSRLRVKEIIESIFVYIPHLESEHIKLLNDILNTQLLTSLDIYCTDEKYYKNHKTFEPISYALYDFYKKTRLLKNFSDRIKI